MKNLARILVAAVFVALISAAKADMLWRQYGFNAAHTSYNNHETALNPSNVSRLALFWTSTPFRAIPTSPILGFDAIFFAKDGQVRATEEQNGHTRWTRLSCSGEGTVQPALGRDFLLVGDGGGDLAAYEPGTSKQVWCDDLGGSIVSPPAVADDTVFITTGFEAIAVDQFTARPHWRFSSADSNPLTNTPALGNGVVFVSGGNSVFALDGITGRKIWRHDLGPNANISSPSVANGIVYVGGTALYALSAVDGHLIWRSRAAGVNVTTPAIAEGRVFVNSEDPNFGLFAFNASNGALLWHTIKPGESEATVTVANGVVYDIADSGELMMFDAATGNFLSQVKDPDGKPFLNRFGSQPIVANGTVYVPTGDFFSPNRIDAFALP